MLRNWRRVVVLVLAQAAVIWGGWPALADGPVPSERRLPKDTVAYVSFHNVADLRTQFALTLMGKIGQDESLAPFWGEVSKQFEELSKHVEDEVGLGIAEIANIPAGEVAAAVFTPRGGKIAAVAFLDFGKREEAVQKLLAKVAEALENHGLKRNEEEVDDTRLVLYQATSEAEGQAKTRDVGGYFLKDTFLVIGSDPAALKAVLSRWDGASENTLADNDVFKYITERCRDADQEAAPVMSWFIDPMGAVRSAISAAQGASLQAAMILGTLSTPQIGVDKLKGIGGTFDLARGEYDMVSRTLVYMEPPVKGILNLFQFDAESQAPPKWVTSEASSYTVVNWNLGKAYAAVEALFDSFQGAGALARQIQKFADNEQTGKIHLKKDIIDLLSGKVHIVGDVTGTGDEIEERMLIAASVKDAAKAKALLTKIAQFPGIPLKEREFQGETIYELEIPGGGDEDEGETRTMAAAVTENHLMFATNVKFLEQVMRGTKDRETLADSPAYQRIARKFPSQTSSLSFSRQDAQVKAAYDFLRSGNAGNAFGPDITIDFAKLPAFDAVKKYLPASGSFMEPDGKGLRFISFSLKSDE